MWMQNGRTPTAYDLFTNNHMELFKKIFVVKFLSYLPFKSLTSFFRQSKKTIDDCMILGHKIIHCYSCKCYKGRYSYAKFSHLGICDLTNFTKVHNKAIDYYICHCPYSCMINESNINKDLKYNYKPGRGRNYYKAETQSNISIPA